MPKIIEPLSAQEKKDILERHHQIVDMMNRYLNGALNYEDEKIIARMNDPQEVKAYRLSLEAKAEDAKREQIYQELKAKYGPNQVENNPLNRTIIYCFKTDNTPTSIRYNEKLYKDYKTNPDKVIYHEVNKIFNFNPMDIYKCGEDKAKLAEFYLEHPEIVKNGFCISPILSSEYPNKEASNSLNSLKKPVEALNYPYIVVQETGSIDYFACPKINQEQAINLLPSPIFSEPGYDSLREIVNNKLGEGENHLDTVKESLDAFIEKGINIDDPQFFIKYKCVETNPTTGKKEQVSFDRYFKKIRDDNGNEIDNPNVKVVQRDKEEIFKLKCINKTMLNAYSKQFENRLAYRLGLITYNIDEIESRNKGGIWERYIKHSTSQQYKDFITALREYNDPSSPNYLNRTNLKGKASAYLDHKYDQGYHGLENMKGTSLSRSNLAMNVIQTINEMELQEETLMKTLENQVIGDYKDVSNSFLKEEDVKEDIIIKEVEEKVVEKENVIDNELSK